MGSHCVYSGIIKCCFIIIWRGFTWWTAYGASEANQWSTVFETAVSVWASAGNRTKQTVDRAIRPQCWVYEWRVITCKWFLKLLWVFCFYYCFNYFICSVNKHYFLLNPRAYLLQYVILIAFPMQQWLHECASMLRYTYIAGLVSPCVRWSLRFLGVWKRIRKSNPDIKYIFATLKLNNGCRTLQ